MGWINLDTTGYEYYTLVDLLSGDTNCGSFDTYSGMSIFKFLSGRFNLDCNLYYYYSFHLLVFESWQTKDQPYSALISRVRGLMRE